MGCMMIVVMMLVSMTASWTMLVCMFFWMMRLVMVPMIMLAPRTMLMMCLFLGMAISFLIVIAVLSMFVSMLGVVLVSTTEIESRLHLGQRKEAVSR
jgi:hypothetical protein